MAITRQRNSRRLPPDPGANVEDFGAKHAPTSAVGIVVPEADEANQELGLRDWGLVL